MLPSFTQIVTGTSKTLCPKGFAIEMMEDTVFTQIEGQISGYESVTFKDGRIIYVNGLLSITLASGSVIVYYV